MITEAINRILELDNSGEVNIEGRYYTTRQLHLVKPPAASPLYLSTLTGLAHYVDIDLDDFNNEERDRRVLHVAHPTEVNLLTELNECREREHLIAARAFLDPFPFGTFFRHEDFMVALQSRFVDTPERARLLKVLSSVTGDEVRTVADDGVTQRVTAKAGVTLTERVDLPSPINLRPFRTFPDIEQPESPFVLRVRRALPGTKERAEADGGLSIALFEADGGAWRLKAIRAIAEWLAANVEGVEVIA